MSMTWWQKFKYEWVPRTQGEWGCCLSLVVGASFLFLMIILGFSLLIRGIGWAWGF